MTREEKIKKKQEREYRRKGKRIAKDLTYLQTADNYGRGGLSWGRRKQQGRATGFTCEMGWSSCEERGYCNGDC